MTHAIYIPTIDRPDFIPGILRNLRAYAGDDINIYVVTVQGHGLTKKAVERLGAIPLFLDSLGIGYTRNRIVAHAASEGHPSIAMVDDDKVVRGDIHGWLRDAERPDVTGIGVFKSYFGLLCRGTRMAAEYKIPGVWLHKGSVGHGIYALNVANVLDLGNYDPSLYAFEDHEMARQSIRQHGVPWMISTGVIESDARPVAYMHSIGSFSGERAERSEPMVRAHQEVYRRWPGYISNPAGRYACAWKRLIRDYTDIESWPLEDILTSSAWDWA